MLTTEVQALYQRLRAGTHQPADVSFLERIKPDELITELATVYPVQFQKRRLKDKWEVGLARRVEFHLVPRNIRGSGFFAFEIVPVLVRSVFLAGEGEALTGVSVVPRIEVRPFWKPHPGVALVTARGYKLGRFPDGWAGQPMPAKTTRLSEDFLRQRGWQFDQLRPAAPTRPTPP